MDSDAGAQLIDVDRLRQVVDASGFESTNDVLGLRQPGHEDDGDLTDRRVCLQFPAGFKSIHGWHDRIQQYEVGGNALHDI